MLTSATDFFKSQKHRVKTCTHRCAVFLNSKLSNYHGNNEQAVLYFLLSLIITSSKIAFFHHTPEAFQSTLKPIAKIKRNQADYTYTAANAINPAKFLSSRPLFSANRDSPRSLSAYTCWRISRARPRNPFFALRCPPPPRDNGKSSYVIAPRRASPFAARQNEPSIAPAAQKRKGLILRSQSKGIGIRDLPIAIVDGIAEAGRVDDRQGEVDTVLLEQDFARLDGDGLLHPQTRARVLGAVDVREEEGIYQRRLAEARLACGITNIYKWCEG